MKLVVTGDNIINRRVSNCSDPRFKELVEIIEGADIAFANLETLINDFQGYPTAIDQGGCLGADEFIADEMKFIGVNIVSRANNHTLDYGIVGMRKTSDILKKRGIVYAGVGENLGQARAPAYLETSQGRVALISAASSFPSWERAVHARKDLQGRPGLNPLRFNTTHIVDEESLNSLKKICSMLKMETFGPGNKWKKPKPEEFYFLEHLFKIGKEPRIETYVNERDLEENLAAIKDAKRAADFVMFSLHVHEAGAHPFRGPWQKQIVHEIFPRFINDFAHEAIDAGADIFVGHGSHFLRPIEIYKGKPIFYGLGNFFFHLRSVKKRSSLEYERFDLDPVRSTPEDVSDAAENLGILSDPVHWETVLPFCTFDDYKLKKIELYPISLGHGKKRTLLGTPYLANEKLGKKIINYYSEMSASYGTKIIYEDSKGMVQL